MVTGNPWKLDKRGFAGNAVGRGAWALRPAETHERGRWPNLGVVEKRSFARDRIGSRGPRCSLRRGMGKRASLP